jgi:hypothetical protein
MIKRIASAIMLFVFSACISAAQNCPVRDIGIDMHTILDVQKDGSTVYILGGALTQPYWEASLYSYTDGESKEISTTYSENGISHNIKVHSYSNITIANTGDLYLAGERLYRYSENEWHAFAKDDEYKEFRSYIDCCIDSTGDVWILTSVRNNSSGLYLSEILKFNGNNFKTVFETDLTSQSFTLGGSYEGKRIICLRDGRIAVTGSMEDNKDHETNNFYIFKGDSVWAKHQIPTNDSEKDNWMKLVNDISEDNEGNLWLTLSKASWMSDDFKDIFYCCSGVSVLTPSGEWTIFDEEMGMDSDDGVSPIMHKYLETEDETYLFGRKRIYKVNSIGTLEQLPGYQVYENAEIIPCRITNYDAESANYYVRKLFDVSITSGISDVREILEVENDIWVVTQSYILVINQMPSSVEELIRKDAVEIFPNPASENITVDENISSYKILNIKGKVLVEAENAVSSTISVSDLPTGKYILQYKTTGGEFKTGMFIKN